MRPLDKIREQNLAGSRNDWFWGWIIQTIMISAKCFGYMWLVDWKWILIPLYVMVIFETIAILWDLRASK